MVNAFFLSLEVLIIVAQVCLAKLLTCSLYSKVQRKVGPHQKASKNAHCSTEYPNTNTDTGTCVLLYDF